MASQLLLSFRFLPKHQYIYIYPFVHAVVRMSIENSELLNYNTFQELLIMDEDDPDFSQSLISTFIEQALSIFEELQEFLEKDAKSDEDLVKMSNLGHYLKGSAAALGLVKIQEECERIQNYGKKKIIDQSDAAKDAKENEQWCDHIKDALEKAQDYFKQSRTLFGEYYNTEL